MSHILSLSDLRVCLVCPEVPLDQYGTKASVSIRPDKTCFACHGATREATAEERVAYRRYINERENPERARWGCRPMILIEDLPFVPAALALEFTRGMSDEDAEAFMSGFRQAAEESAEREGR